MFGGERVLLNALSEAAEGPVLAGSVGIAFLTDVFLLLTGVLQVGFVTIEAYVAVT